LKDYEQLQQIEMMEANQPIALDDFLILSYPNGQSITQEDLGIWKSDLIGNISGAITKLENLHWNGEKLNLIIENFYNYINGNVFNTDLYNEELLVNINACIERYEKNISQMELQS
jgi:hypothetical protein